MYLDLHIFTRFKVQEERCCFFNWCFLFVTLSMSEAPLALTKESDLHTPGLNSTCNDKTPGAKKTQDSLGSLSTFKATALGAELL